MKKMYSVLFPLWMILFNVKLWLIFLPFTFIISTIVLLISLKVFKVGEICKAYKENILRVWIINILSSLLGSILVVGIQMLPTSSSFLKDMVGAISYSPFSNIYATIAIIVCIAISAVVAALLNYKFLFKKSQMDSKLKLKIVIVIAVILAPFLLLYPAEKNYSNENASVNLEVLNEFSGNTLTTRIFAESQNYTNSEFKYNEKVEKVDSNLNSDLKSSEVNMKISNKYDNKEDKEKYEKWAKQCGLIVFIKQKEIDEIVIDLKDENSEVCKLTYQRDEFEKEFNINFSEIENDSTKVENVLTQIKNGR